MKVKRLFFVAAFSSLLVALAMPTKMKAQSWPPAGMTGSGTSGSPWQITSAAHLDSLARYVNAGNGTSGVYYKLMNDISLSGYANWQPIGGSTSFFMGNFNGNGKVIRNLTINRPTEDYIGLFGRINWQGTVYDFGVENCNITGHDYVGGITGEIANNMYRCYVIGNVNGSDGVGGLVGRKYSGVVYDCYAVCNVTATSGSAGGLAGSIVLSELTGYMYNCYATGKVKGQYACGLVWGSMSIAQNCVAALDSVIGTTQASSIGNGYYCYALNTMIVRDNSGVVNIPSGAAKSLTELRSLAFYTNAGNWTTGRVWDISSPTSVWVICEGENSPFLRWQGIVCLKDMFCGGNGTAGNPYQICTPQTLKALADFVNNGNATNGVYYKLMNDISLSIYANWEPIGKVWTSSFQGNFDGNGKVISYLKINRSTEDDIGLFGICGGTIKNLGVENCNVIGQTRVGGLAGNYFNIMTNCYTTGSIRGSNVVGGLVGYTETSNISNCYSTCNVSGSGNNVGGLIGHEEDGGITINCYTTGKVSGNNNVGGLIGYDMEGEILYCYATGSVKGNSSIGGVLGFGMNTIYIRNSIAANDSLIATSNATSINRVFVGGNNNNNYALNTIVVRNSSGNITVTDGAEEKPITDLQSRNFYTTAGNWKDSAWSITDPNGIWKICDDEPMFPFLRWQGINCFPAFCGGNGTAGNPFQICTHEQLKALADFVNAGNGTRTRDKYFKLINDIDLSSYANWQPIGDYTNHFIGNFDGNGKVIQNLKINRPTEENIGLFGVCEGTIKNLGVENCNVIGQNNVGGLAGYSYATISNCYATGAVTGSIDVGGLVGNNQNSYISNCYATVAVTGNYHVGGLVGGNHDSPIFNCYATGAVTGNDIVGGLVGDNSFGSITNCVAANGTITASGNIDRIMGGADEGWYSLSNNYALQTMLVNGAAFTGTPNKDNMQGANATLTDLQSFSFYSTASNWKDSAWSITDPNGIWRICDGEGLPFLRWQGVLCSNEYRIVASSSAGGSIIPSGSIVVLRGEDKTFTFSPNNSDYAIDEVLIDNVNNPSSIADGSYTFTNIDSDHTIHVTFKSTVGIGAVGTGGVPFVRVYPNPTDGKLSVISSQFSEKGGEIKIYDVVGQCVFVSAVSSTSPETTIDISHLAAGLYFLKIDGKTFKVVKE